MKVNKSAKPAKSKPLDIEGQIRNNPGFGMMVVMGLLYIGLCILF